MIDVAVEETGAPATYKLVAVVITVPVLPDNVAVPM